MWSEFILKAVEWKAITVEAHRFEFEGTGPQIGMSIDHWNITHTRVQRKLVITSCITNSNSLLCNYFITNLHVQYNINCERGIIYCERGGGKLPWNNVGVGELPRGEWDMKVYTSQTSCPVLPSFSFVLSKLQLLISLWWMMASEWQAVWPCSRFFFSYTNKNSWLIENTFLKKLEIAFCFVSMLRRVMREIESWRSGCH